MILKQNSLASESNLHSYNFNLNFAVPLKVFSNCSLQFTYSLSTPFHFKSSLVLENKGKTNLNGVG